MTELSNKNAESYWASSRCLKDFGTIVGLICFHGYVFDAITYKPMSLFAVPYVLLVPTFYYSIPIFGAFAFGVRSRKSPLVFAALSLVILVLHFAWEIQVADRIGLSRRVMGMDVYIEGDVTADGVVFEILKDPTVFALLYALVLVVISYRKQATAKKRN